MVTPPNQLAVSVGDLELEHPQLKYTRILRRQKKIFSVAIFRQELAENPIMDPPLSEPLLEKEKSSQFRRCFTPATVRMWTRIFTEFRKLEHVIAFLYYLRAVPRHTLNRFVHLAGFVNSVTGGEYTETQLQVTAENVECLFPSLEDRTLHLDDDVLHKQLLAYGASNAKRENVGFTFMPHQDTCCGENLEVKPWHSSVLFRYGLSTVNGVQYRSECMQCSTQYYMSHYDNATGRHYYLY